MDENEIKNEIETDVSDIPSGAALKAIKYFTDDYLTQGELQEKTRDDQKPVAIAIVNKSGNLIAFIGMDKVNPIDVELSIAKACAAQKFEADTIDLRDLRRLTSNRPYLYGGGITIRNMEGKVIGAIGVSGRDTGEENHKIVVDEALYHLKTVLISQKKMRDHIKR
ncbi:heme-binding protein [Candidatus Parcubacteria bacterium]|nr:heme-binding protein [Candidatus Parcubacteria bacterium]